MKVQAPFKGSCCFLEQETYCLLLVGSRKGLKWDLHGQNCFFNLYIFIFLFMILKCITKMVIPLSSNKEDFFSFFTLSLEDDINTLFFIGILKCVSFLLLHCNNPTSSNSVATKRNYKSE